ncbi:MAG TPA: DUF4159 domain-containing protein [Bryobacteraceae bacterium]|nr:DUF4159 domain-containing protein [Bryobacteraceae bacterium]
MYKFVCSRFLLASVATSALICAAFAQRPFREYPGFEYENFPIPPDWRVPGEWAFARLMYPSAHRFYAGEYPRPYHADWWDGRTDWTIDYPRSDRHLSAAVRRLTRIQARSVEEPVNLDDGNEVYNWPWLYGVEVGHWNLTDAQAAKLRDFLLRGGFFMCDDFHGTDEWNIFIASMSRVFPDRPIVDIENSNPIFHTIFDLDDRYQVPGEQFVYSHRVYEKDGYVPHWRGIFDDKGRIMVAICHDMDLGDSWENADNPLYPEKYTALGMRIGINYIVYAMTH